MQANYMRCIINDNRYFSASSNFVNFCCCYRYNYSALINTVQHIVNYYSTQQIRVSGTCQWYVSVARVTGTY